MAGTRQRQEPGGDSPCSSFFKGNCHTSRSETLDSSADWLLKVNGADRPRRSHCQRRWKLTIRPASANTSSTYNSTNALNLENGLSAAANTAFLVLLTDLSGSTTPGETIFWIHKYAGDVLNQDVQGVSPLNYSNAYDAEETIKYLGLEMRRRARMNKLVENKTAWSNPP